MLIHPRILSTAAAIAVTCAVSAAAYYYKSRNRELNEVMIFCKLQYNAHNCFDKLMSYLESAKRSVNVCMPGIHNPAIQGRLVNLIKKKKIKTRIIIDRSGYNESTDFLIDELKKSGAEIKYITKDPMHKMHHKFCIVDDNMLMTGTLNWGNDRSSDHWNYVYVTSKMQLVDPVKQGFYQMWNEYTSEIDSLTNDKYNDSDATTNIDKNIIERKDADASREKSATPELFLK